MSQAAAGFGLAQPALSQQMRELEQEVGVRLLERHSRGIRPTAAGKAMFQRAAELDRFIHLMLAEVRAIDSDARPVTIGLPPSLMRLVGAEFLVAENDDSGPSLRFVEALSVALMNAVVRREIDIALAYEVEDQPGVIRVPVVLDELLYVTLPDGPDAPISFKDALAAELSFAGTQGIEELVRRKAAGMGLVPRIASNVQSVSAVRLRIAQGGASLLSYGTVADGVRRGTFMVRRIENPAMTRTLYLLRQADSDPVLRDPRLAATMKRMIHSILRESAPYATLLDSRFISD